MLAASATTAVNWYSFHPSFSAWLQWIGVQGFCMCFLDQSVLSFIPATSNKHWTVDKYLEKYRSWSFTDASLVLNRTAVSRMCAWDMLSAARPIGWAETMYFSHLLHRTWGHVQLLNQTSNSTHWHACLYFSQVYNLQPLSIGILFQPLESAVQFSKTNINIYHTTNLSLNSIDW